MTETPDFAERVDWHGNANVLDETEHEALDYFLSDGGRKSIKEYQGPERRTLSGHIDRLVPAVLGFKMTTKRDSEAGEFVNFFKDYAPTTLLEARILKNGIEPRIKDKEKNPKYADSAVTRLYNKFREYIFEASQDMHTLDAFIVPRSNGEPKPDIELFRTSQTAHDIIARQLTARNLLWNKSHRAWPNRTSNIYQERYKYWLGFTVAASRFAKDETVEEIYNFASSRAELRLDNLGQQLIEMKKLPIVDRLEKEGKVGIPINVSQLWQRKVVHSEQAIQEREASSSSSRNFKVPESIGHLVTPEALAAIPDDQTQAEGIPVKPKEEIISEHEARALNEAELRAKLEDRNWQPGWIDREIASPLDPEQEQKRSDAKTRFIRGLGKSKKSRGGYKRGWRETGASDKRVETD